jgi:hydroxyethylthiazole kinase-like uncharacterized protein yjeF
VGELFGLRLGPKNSAFLHSEERLYTLETDHQLPLHDFHWIIDGLFGSGLTRPLDGPVQELLQKVNASPAQRIAVDVPSGVDINNGRVLGEAFRADHTLTIAAPKRGLYLLPGREYCGEIHCIQVDSLSQAIQARPCGTHALPHFVFRDLRPRRDHHKYSRGVVSVAMSEAYPGAALLSAMAAQQAGAGYVQVWCPLNKLSALQIQYPFLVFHPYENEQDLSRSLVEDQSQSCVVGPGWKDFPDAIELPEHSDKKYVLDGGFLQPKTLRVTRSLAKQMVITPHQGELRRLLPGESSSRWDQVDTLLRQWDGVIVAKGYDTIIGQGSNRRWITTWNSPTLATAGSGDILTGIIAAFMAQDFSPQQAACLAVDAHRRLPLYHPVCLSPQGMLQRIEAVLNNPDDLSNGETP